MPDISCSSVEKLASRATLGTPSPVRIRSDTCISSLRPSAPPGCDSAKSVSRKPRASSSATDSASPIAICAVVLAVGARLSVQASLSTAHDSTMSDTRASDESGRPVSATSVTPRRRSAGMMALSSLDSPEFEISRQTSPDVTMPRSPCAASAGCTKNDGVPVDASVAAILRPT